MSHNLNDRAELFSRSIRLATAHTSLEKIASGEKLNSKERQRLRWTASLIADADRDSSYYGETTLNCVEQTTFAADFYKTLSNLGYKFRPSFLDNFYLLLKFGGDGVIPESELKEGKELIKRMADDALVKLQYNRY